VKIQLRIATKRTVVDNALATRRTPVCTIML